MVDPTAAYAAPTGAEGMGGTGVRVRLFSWREVRQKKREGERGERRER